jgi:hypothetical protein
MLVLPATPKPAKNRKSKPKSHTTSKSKKRANSNRLTIRSMTAVNDWDAMFGRGRENMPPTTQTIAPWENSKAIRRPIRL